MSARSRKGAPLVVALLLCVVAEVAVRVGASHLPPPQNWSTPEIQLKVMQIDAMARAHETGGIVFIASSVLDVGFDPKAFIADTHTRLPVYDASISGANLDELGWWLDHVVLPRLKPKVVVIGMSSREINANDPQATTDAEQFFASDPVRHVNGDENIFQWLSRYASDLSYLFRYRTVLRDPDEIVHHTNAVQVQQRFFVSPLGQQLALTLQPYHAGATVQSEFETTFFDHFAVSPPRLANLAGMFTAVRKAGAQAVLLDVPVTEEYILLHPRTSVDYAAYQEAIAGVAARSDVPMIPGQIWTTSYFADPLHLNEVGALHLASVLLAELPPAIRSIIETPPAIRSIIETGVKPPPT